MLASMKAGDYLFIAFGINDGDSTCPRHVGSARFVELLGVMAKAAKAKGVTPIFLTPTDAIACSGSTVTQNRGFLTETKSAGSSNGVTVIDLNALSMALYKQLALCPNSADYTSTTSAVGKFFCEDHTHFESAGAKQIAGVVANAIKTQVPALAPYLL
jgi:lysophospholipase L1-like esterase